MIAVILLFHVKMCTIPPPPPPIPPTTCSPKLSSSSKPVTTLKVIRLTQENLCTWADKNQELKETCIKNSICLYKDPFKYKIRDFESIQQVGPTCGIVAVSMLLNGRLTTLQILNLAKDLGYTNNGEMFSCKQLADLARQALDLANIDNITVRVQKGTLLSQDTIDKLLDGAVMLVPYPFLFILYGQLHCFIVFI